MNYIVFDLEFNQGWNPEENDATPNYKCPFEIIQIGALRLDEKLNTVSGLNSFIKPKLYTELHPYVSKITGITPEVLASGKSFKEVYTSFLQLIDKESILCTWGISDIKELMRNARYHNLDTALIPKEYINIQRYASRYLHCPRGTNVGLQNAVELLGIPLGSSFHDAYNDACYTAEVFRRINNENIKPALYGSFVQGRRRQAVKKTRLDTVALIKQFEKMYGREMTEEEQSIIKLAYIMGKTNQFQV